MTRKPKIILGIICGAVAGIIDVIPMIIQNLTWDANLSAFSMWIIIGFFLSTVDLHFNPMVKGILVSFLCLIPSLFIIGWKEPASLIPICIMTVILGGLLGYSIHYLSKKMNLIG